MKLSHHLVKFYTSLSRTDKMEHLTRFVESVRYKSQVYPDGYEINGADEVRVIMCLFDLFAHSTHNPRRYGYEKALEDLEQLVLTDFGLTKADAWALFRCAVHHLVDSKDISPHISPKVRTALADQAPNLIGNLKLVQKIRQLQLAKIQYMADATSDCTKERENVIHAVEVIALEKSGDQASSTPKLEFLAGQIGWAYSQKRRRYLATPSPNLDREIQELLNRWKTNYLHGYASWIPGDFEATVRELINSSTNNKPMKTYRKDSKESISEWAELKEEEKAELTFDILPKIEEFDPTKEYDLLRRVLVPDKNLDQYRLELTYRAAGEEPQSLSLPVATAAHGIKNLLWLVDNRKTSLSRTLMLVDLMQQLNALSGDQPQGTSIILDAARKIRASKEGAHRKKDIDLSAVSFRRGKEPYVLSALDNGCFIHKVQTRMPLLSSPSETKGYVPIFVPMWTALMELLQTQITWNSQVALEALKALEKDPEDFDLAMEIYPEILSLTRLISVDAEKRIRAFEERKIKNLQEFLSRDIFAEEEAEPKLPKSEPAETLSVEIDSPDSIKQTQSDMAYILEDGVYNIQATAHLSGVVGSPSFIASVYIKADKRVFAEYRDCQLMVGCCPDNFDWRKGEDPFLFKEVTLLGVASALDLGGLHTHTSLQIRREYTSYSSFSLSALSPPPPPLKVNVTPSPEKTQSPAEESF